MSDTPMPTIQDRIAARADADRKNKAAGIIFLAGIAATFYLAKKASKGNNLVGIGAALAVGYLDITNQWTGYNPFYGRFGI